MRFSLLLPLLLVVGAGCDSAGLDASRADGAYAASATAQTADARTTAGRPLTATLSGADEVGPGGVLGVGDPDGSGSARIRVNPGLGQVCWDISVADIDTPTAGHIHEAPAGRNGPVVVNFGHQGSVELAGCTSVTRELALELIQAPQDYYVNIHNQPFPGGALRGQLSR